MEPSADPNLPPQPPANAGGQQRFDGNIIAPSPAPGSPVTPQSASPPPAQPIETPSQPVFQPGNAYPPPTGPVANAGPVLFQNDPKPVKSRRFRFSRRVLAFSLVLLIVLGGSAAAYFGYYVPNQPDNLWGGSLVNMGKGYDKIADYINTGSGAKGSKVSGSFKTTGDFASDGTFSEQDYGSTAQFNLGYSAAGIKITAQALALPSTTSSPDIYFKVDGLEGLGSLLGSDEDGLSSTIDSLNGQWYFIDHSLLDQYESSVGGSSQFTKADLNAVIKAVGDPSKKYLFTKDTQNAVFVVKQAIGKEKVDGRSTYHYKIGVNKNNLKAYNTALCASLATTKLAKELQSLDSSYNSDCKDTSDIDSIKDSSTADVWVDTHTRLIHKVQFNSGDKGAFFALSQDYQGGNKVPFGINFEEKEDTSNLSGQLALTLDLSSHVITFTGGIKLSGDTNLAASMNYTVSPDNTPVKITKPANAKNLIELLDNLGLGDIFSDSFTGSQTTSKDTKRKTDINALQGQLEAYEAENGYYPTLANLNSNTWRDSNMKGLDSTALQDPDGTAQTLAAAPAAKVYSYQVTPAGCDNTAIQCSDYTLTATLDDGTPYAKLALNGPDATNILN